MAREDLHFRLRIPEDLKKRIEAAADESRRSMTAEIVARLEESFDARSGGLSDQEILRAKSIMEDLLACLPKDRAAHDIAVIGAIHRALTFLTDSPENEIIHAEMLTPSGEGATASVVKRLYENDAELQKQVEASAKKAEDQATRFLEKRGWKLIPPEGDE